MHVQRDVDEVLRDGLADDIPLLVRGVLEELLAQVVAEGVWRRVSAQERGRADTDMAGRTGHEVREVSERLAEDHVAVLRNAFLELLLEVAAAVLVLAKLRDLTHQVLQSRAREPVDCMRRKVFNIPTSVR